MATKAVFYQQGTDLIFKKLHLLWGEGMPGATFCRRRSCHSDEGCQPQQKYSTHNPAIPEKRVRSPERTFAPNYTRGEAPAFRPTAAICMSGLQIAASAPPSQAQDGCHKSLFFGL